jgi:hypothetical protein
MTSDGVIKIHYTASDGMQPISPYPAIAAENVWKQQHLLGMDNFDRAEQSMSRVIVPYHSLSLPRRMYGSGNICCEWIISTVQSNRYPELSSLVLTFTKRSNYCNFAILCILCICHNGLKWI